MAPLPRRIDLLHVGFLDLSMISKGYHHESHMSSLV